MNRITKQMGIGIAVLVLFCIDRLTKAWVISHCFLNSTCASIPGVNLRYIQNTGAAFGLLSNRHGWEPWVVLALGMFFTGFFLQRVLRLSVASLRERGALVLVLSGALGNGYDRLRWGWVIDFIDVHAQGYHFPTFNCADGFICIGVLLLCLGSTELDAAYTRPAHPSCR